MSTTEETAPKDPSSDVEKTEVGPAPVEEVAEAAPPAASAEPPAEEPPKPEGA